MGPDGYFGLIMSDMSSCTHDLVNKLFTPYTHVEFFFLIKIDHNNVFLLVSCKIHEIYQSFKGCYNKSKLVLDDEHAQNHATNNDAMCT